jgi:glycosyltransferase involved in cell wall biosynthesis
MKDLITIIIPCKNEKDVIQKTLDLLNYQIGINGVNVIISDSSNDEETVNKLLNRVGDKFNLKVIEGGLPSVARNNGFKYVTTDYVLFLDADIFLLNSDLINYALNTIVNENKDLVSYKFKTDSGEYNYVYFWFGLIQKIMSLFSPFCLGGFMLFNSERFKSIGGFNEKVKVGEDYIISKSIKCNKIKIINKNIYTTSRRFENKGLWFMVKLLLKTSVKINKINYLKNDYNYWD